MLSAWKAKMSTRVTSSADDRDRLEPGQERRLEPLGALATRMSTARLMHAERQRDDDEDEHRVEQDLERHLRPRGPPTRNFTIGAKSTSMIRSFTETWTSV